MKFSLNDEFILKNVECRVVYVNNEFAWLAPIYDDETYLGEFLNPICAFTRIGPKLIDSKGNKARVNKKPSNLLT